MHCQGSPPSVESVRDRARGCRVPGVRSFRHFSSNTRRWARWWAPELHILRDVSLRRRCLWEQSGGDAVWRACAVPLTQTAPSARPPFPTFNGCGALLRKFSICDGLEFPMSCGAWAETREPPKDQFMGAGARGIRPGPKTSSRIVAVRIIRSLTAVGPLAFNMSLFVMWVVGIYVIWCPESTPT